MRYGVPSPIKGKENLTPKATIVKRLLTEFKMTAEQPAELNAVVGQYNRTNTAKSWNDASDLQA